MQIPRVLRRSGAAHQLMPPTAGWHATWELLFACDMLAKPVMRRAVHGQLASVYEKVKSVRSYRRPLVELLFEFWMQRVERAEGGGCSGDMGFIGRRDHAPLH
ncbi:hypothetical protein DFH11DRAFT_1193460 [Phellopilus nigrolimitatus]|nr:hypothetical protein DFH11DRAFT_1193460 [Phellopilus nigrolimitatus]